MKKNTAVIIVLAFAFGVYGQTSPSDEAESLFAKGEYFKGMNILTEAINAADPVQRADALQTYARFYENLAGNTGYALTLYGDILKTNLADDHSIKSSAQKEISRLKSLKVQYGSEDILLKRLHSAESISSDKNNWQITQLRSIIDTKPQYYRLSEVYYYLGRSYLAVGNYQQAYLALGKAVELKPAINFYLPVNVYKDTAYAEWIRSTVKSVSRRIIGVLLIITIIAFYSSRPWRWLKLRHLIAGLIMTVLWLIVFSVSCKLLTSSRTISDKTIAEISAAVPCFVRFEAGGPNWRVVENLFICGLIGVLWLFVFSIGTGRLKYRWAAILANTTFALLLFTSLTVVFYMQNCDQKSVFNSDVQNGVLHYIKGNSYFVNFGMEPYILTNPRAYQNLAIINVTDVHMREWIQKYCQFSVPANQSEK